MIGHAYLYFMDVSINGLFNQIGLRVCKKAFNAVVNEATAVSWMRDPFIIEDSTSRIAGGKDTVLL